MAEFNTRIRLKRDTSANWTNSNPVILDGEIIIVDTASGSVRRSADADRCWAWRRAEWCNWHFTEYF